MQKLPKEIWVITLGTLVISAFAVMMRWLQNINIYEEETELANASGISTLLVLIYILAAGIIAYFVFSLRNFSISSEPETAFEKAPFVLNIGLSVLSLVMGVGCVIMFFSSTDMVQRLTALFGLFTIPALMLYPRLTEWGGLGAFLSVIPVVFFSLWLVVAYRINAIDPVLWHYGPMILGIALTLLSVYSLCAYLFYRAKPKRALAFCCYAAVFDLSVVTDSFQSLGNRIILAAWALGLLCIVWIMIYNMTPLEPPQEEEESY